MTTEHIPVLFNETIETLNPQTGETFVDGTLGGGGHAEEIMKRISPGGTLIATDLDPDAIEKAKRRLQTTKNQESLDVRVALIQDSYSNLPSILENENIKGIDGLLLDLGFSSDQLKPNKGFSYMKDEPLIMRYDGDIEGFTAARLLNEYNEKQLAKIIKEYGEERFADRIANAISKKRREDPFRTTRQLVETIESAIPGQYDTSLHPAARTFMAIRIYINKELENVEEILKQIPKIMNPEGRVAIISFHSLEDRIVKNHFKKLTTDDKAKYIKELVKPSEEEIIKNNRSRSAKLRTIKII